MKKLLILMVSVIYLQATSNQELFLQANELYKNQEYQKALESYQAIGKKGCATWYNMGNCSYYVGNKEQALIYWCAAQRGALPHVRKDARANIQYLRTHNSDVLTVALRAELLSWLGLYGSYSSIFMWQILALCTWFLFWYIFTAYRHRRKLIVALGMLTLMSASMLCVRYVEQSELKGYVSQPGVTIFSGPNKEYHVLGTIDEVACVAVERVEGAWCQICYKQLLGWVPIAKLELV